MKEHAKKALKHDVEVLGKTVPTIAVLALFLIGSGSAAVLTEFGTVTGNADVENQALTVSNTDSSQTYNGDAAPLTDGTVVEITNNNDNRFVDYEWTIRDEVETGPDNFDQYDNAYREVYEVQEYDLYSINVNDKSSPSEDDESNDYDVKVTPNVDQVEYQIEVPQRFFDNGHNLDVEISRESADNYHIKYDASESQFYYKNPSATGSQKEATVSSFEPFRGGNADDEDNTVTFTIGKSTSYSQTFWASVNFGGGEKLVTQSYEDRNDGDYVAGYHDSKTETHEDIDFTDHLGTEATVSPSGTQEYNVGVFLDSSTNSEDSFDLNIGVDPVTAGQ